MRRVLAVALFGFLAGTICLAESISVTPSGGGSGSVTSIATSCGVTGGPITSTGTLSGAVTPNAQTGASYAILNADCGKLITVTNASTVALTLAQAGASSQFLSGWYVQVANIGSTAATITPTTSTIDGAAAVTLAPGMSIGIVSDGANYFTTRGITAVKRNYIVNNLILAPDSAALATGVAANNGTGRFYPFVADSTVTIDQLAVRVGTTSAGGNAQAALYAHNPATCRPTGSQIVATGNLSTASGAVVAGSVTATRLVQGTVYWLGTNLDNATAVLTSNASAAGATMARLCGSATGGNLIIAASGAALVGVSTPLTFNTWGDLSGATWTEVVTSNSIPAVAMRVSAVP